MKSLAQTSWKNIVETETKISIENEKILKNSTSMLSEDKFQKWRPKHELTTTPSYCVVFDSFELQIIHKLYSCEGSDSTDTEEKIQ